MKKQLFYYHDGRENSGIQSMILNQRSSIDLAEAFKLGSIRWYVGVCIEFDYLNQKTSVTVLEEHIREPVAMVELNLEAKRKPQPAKTAKKKLPEAAMNQIQAAQVFDADNLWVDDLFPAPPIGAVEVEPADQND